MSRFIEELKSEVNGWASAYLQFQTGHRREGFEAYAFVEDDDDKSFYQNALPDYTNICFLGCGGKSGVLSVFKKMRDDKTEDSNLFFCDKDCEEPPYQFVDEVFRTDYYSWESYVCEPKYVSWFLQRKLDPNLTQEEMASLNAAWSQSLQNFQHPLSRFTSLCWAASNLMISLNMDSVRVGEKALFYKGVLHPGSNAHLLFVERENIAVENGLPRNMLKARQQEYEENDPLFWAQGKSLFALLRVFTALYMKANHRTCSHQLNSPKSWAQAMPFSSDLLVPIRSYVARRLSGFAA